MPQKAYLGEMRYLSGLLGAVLAQTFYVEVGNEALRQTFRQGAIQVARLGGVWRAVSQVKPLQQDAAHPLGGWFVMRFAEGDSQAIMEMLRQVPGVEWVEGAMGRRLCAQPLPGWHHVALGTSAAWTRTQGSPTIVIALIDSGIEWTLPAFHRQLWVNPAEDLNGNGIPDPDDLNGIDDDGNGFVDDVIGYDFTDQPYAPAVGDNSGMDPYPRDENGHGTAMASVIGARLDRSPVAGVAPGARMMILRCFNAEGYGEDDDIARAIVYAADNGARIINCSFGDQLPSRMMQAAIQYAVGRGCVIIAASGNGTGRMPHFPSGFPEVIAVGGVGYDESAGRYYLWPLSGYYRVDWVAPSDRVPALLPDGSVQPLSGTSIAAALSSAAAALLLSQYPDLSAEGVRATFTSRAIPLTGNTWSPFFGSGRLTLLPAIDLPQEATAGWMYPPDNALLRSPVPVVFSTYHSLLREWEISHAPTIEGPWQVLKRGHNAVLRDTLRGWLPPPGQHTLRLLLRLQNGREEAYLLTLTHAPQGIALRHVRTASGWSSGLSGSITDWQADFPVTGCIRTERGYFCADKVDGTGAVWLPPVSEGQVEISTLTDTVAFPLTLPAVPVRTLPYAPWRRRPHTAPAGFYLPEQGEDWNGDGEKDLIMSGFRPEDGRPGRLYFLRRVGDKYVPHDSADYFPLLPRHLMDWDGDGRPELLCVWIDSFYVLGGSPPKNLLWKGAGRAARLAPDRHIWIRTSGGAYELRQMDGTVRIVLPDTVQWSGSTTVPRIIPVFAPAETLWSFGNFPGWIFLYRSDGTLLRSIPTGLREAGSHLLSVDVDEDGWTEILYLGQGASGTWWELGLFSVKEDSILWRERFWGGVAGRARLFLSGDTVLIWLPPHLYTGRLSTGGWQGQGFDAGAWETFGVWRIADSVRVLLGRDSLPRFYDYSPPVQPATTWAQPGGLSPTTARLRWHALPQPTTYNLYRFVSTGAALLRYSGTDTAFIDTGLLPGEWYAYVIETGGASSEPFFLRPGERPCLERATMDSTGTCTVQGRGIWEGEGSAPFRLLPDSASPFFAWANGNRWILSFSAQARGDTLWIDTLLTDAYGMYLRGDCGRVPVELTYVPQCLLPLRWRIRGERSVEIDFPEILPSEAFDPRRYQVYPAGVIEEVVPTAQGIRLTLSINLQTQPVVIRWRWGDPRCARTVALSPARETEAAWGFFPNPLRREDRSLRIWGLAPGEEVRVLTPTGDLCAVIRGSDAEVPVVWDLRTISGGRIASGIYLLERKGAFEKLFVE